MKAHGEAGWPIPCRPSRMGGVTMNDPRTASNGAPRACAASEIHRFRTVLGLAPRFRSPVVDRGAPPVGLR